MAAASLLVGRVDDQVGDDGDVGEVAVRREEKGRLLLALCGDQAVDGRGRDSGASASVEDLRGADVGGLVCEHNGKSAHEPTELLELGLVLDAGQEFLEDDSGNPDVRIGLNEVSELANGGVGSITGAPAAKGQRPDRGVDEDHALDLAFL
jgi:hypothetical protein